jgi:hypothetical protein
VQEAAERQREEVRQKLEAKLARGKPRIVSDFMQLQLHTRPQQEPD